MKYEFLLSNAILSILLIILLYLLYKPGVYVVSDIDNKEYFVSENNSLASANTLAKIRNNMNKLVKYLNSINNKEYSKYVDELTEKIREIDISENTKNIYTSYAINKKELVFCIKSKKDGSIHDINLLMYVVLHEMAHLACPEYGHGDLFKKIFKYLLQKADECGIYTPIDFSMHPQEYCGMNITVG